jgi:hypothetical protein
MAEKVDKPTENQQPTITPTAAPAPKTEVCTRSDISTKDLIELVEEADDRFAHVGGTKYEYIHQVFFPLLKEKGYVICRCN